VPLPGSVKYAIEERAEALGFTVLERAATELSNAYRDRRPARLTAEERTAAYLVTRMPATYAAALTVLREVSALPIASVLDVGSGTGAASLAARQLFPAAALTLVERDPAFAEASRLWLPDAQLIAADVKSLDPMPPRDLVIAAYSLGEIGERAAKRLWQAARVALVVIEPGTPEGYRLVMSVRDTLLASGAHIAAPCPAGTPCPIAAPDWCHFAARVERSSLHRRIKHAELGYEDEKFSYIALSREPVPFPDARVIRRTRQTPGLVVLETCTPGGLETESVRKRDRDRYRAARRAEWGGRWSKL
jgi:ribosomal protein RSM22 (predicted rRNA methylase)